MTDWPLILAEHSSAVWRTVYRLLGRRDDSLDCYQETFLSACRFARRKPVEDWRSFLTSLAIRRAMDRLRQRYRERATFTDALPAQEPGSDADSPLLHASAGELLDRVRAALVELPEKQSQVFWLSCIEGLPHERIGRQLGIPPGEVRVLLHRARGRLAAILDPLNEEDDHDRQPATKV
jgi:RNA polymerase sigma-70 factor (ECF subfamily)